MSDIKSWSNSAGGNTAATPNGWPEGQSPSSVNDCAREMMASLRRQHEDAEWIDYGWTPSFATTASFTLVGDRRTQFHAGRRIKAYDASVLYGKISDVTYSSNTRVSVTLDSGELAASLSAVAVGILSFTNQSIPEVSATASFARSASFATSASSAAAVTDGTNVIKTKIINIGDWDMSATDTARVAHGLDFTKIVMVSASIRPNSGSTFSKLFPLSYFNGTSPGGNIVVEDETNLLLTRFGGGTFNNANFNSSSYNRGWTKITYIE